MFWDNIRIYPPKEINYQEDEVAFYFTSQPQGVDICIVNFTESLALSPS